MSSGTRLERWRGKAVYQALLLAGVALAVSLVLALAHALTLEPIALRQAEDTRRALAAVLPGTLYDNDPLAERLTVEGEEGAAIRFYPARRDGALVGAAFEQVTRQGYGGPMRLLLAVDQQGVLLGVRVLSHSETPGLGDKIEATGSDWILGFEGRSLDNTPADDWAVRKDGGAFDQFTGATITPRAVVAAVREGLVQFATHRPELARQAPPPETSP